MRIWDTQNSAKVPVLPGVGEESIGGSLVFSADGQMLASYGASGDGKVYLWNTWNGVLLKVLHATGWVGPAVFSPDNQRSSRTAIRKTRRTQSDCGISPPLGHWHSLAISP